jgi:hypothetical protein
LEVSSLAAGTLVYDGLLAVGEDNVVQAELGPARGGVAKVLVHALHGKKLSEAKRAQRVLSALNIVRHDAVLSTAVRMVTKNRNSNVTAFIAEIPVVGGINLLGSEGEKRRRDANNTGYAPNMEITGMQQPRVFGRVQGFSRSALDVQTELR